MHNSHDARKNYGYVFLDCTVKSECKQFTFARSWGGESTCYWINTKVLDNSLAASRWTTAGMNIAAYCFKEYNTTDAEGNVTTPASNVVNFTHNTGNREYETVLMSDGSSCFGSTGSEGAAGVGVDSGSVVASFPKKRDNRSATD